MNKVLAIFVIGCLINVCLSARLPRKADTNDSSSEESVSLPEILTQVIESIAVIKNITLTEAQKSGVSEILNKGWIKSASDKDDITLQDIEKFKTELSAVIPSEVAEEVSSIMSKFTKDASSDEAAEGFVCLGYFLFTSIVDFYA
ncbi:uncharacterized protein LOC119072986 [Bradysia coprophila]|uniref:uncharacterized protein LOC119072986 n=1 Tax=Bradysia coprophila TaxID=38358 RepID=UPI00187DC486|nr:uncharacterized protein LOC119072986 [Bradysia coprophila]